LFQTARRRLFTLRELFFTKWPRCLKRESVLYGFFAELLVSCGNDTLDRIPAKIPCPAPKTLFPIGEIAMKRVRSLLPIRWFVLILCWVVELAIVLCAKQALADEPDKQAARWYKGNTHAHTFWSDGNELPELVVDFFKSHDYQFLAVSDHDILMQGERWLPVDAGQRPVPAESIEEARKRFGSNSVVLRENANGREVKLKTFDELAAQFNMPGKFLLIQNEEVTSCWETPNIPPAQQPNQNIHLNAIHLAEIIQPKVGQNAVETLDLNFALVKEQAERLHRPILAQVNHPNWSEYDISAEDLAQVEGIRFFEVASGFPTANNLGDATHPSTEKLWDVANTIRIAKMKTPPLYGVGADDSHNYHDFSRNHVNPGRSWIMVRAEKLTPEAILEAMNRGDFYISTGVVLSDVAFDVKNRVYQVKVQAEPGVKYTIEFIGTLEGADTAFETIAPEPNAPVQCPGRKYSQEVGRVLASSQGDSATYQLTGKELYVRAVVRSDKPRENPGITDATVQQAWCQPVGW
jgi:hypothetical protein